MKDGQMPFNDIERRSEPRQIYYQPIEFALENPEGRLLTGTIFNLSKSGLGIYAHTPLKCGDVITIKNHIPTGYRTYTVRWVNRLLDDFFVAGLKCKEQARADKGIAGMMQPVTVVCRNCTSVYKVHIPEFAVCPRCGTSEDGNY